MWKQDIIIAWLLAAFAFGLIALASVVPTVGTGNAPAAQANVAPNAQVNVRSAGTIATPVVREDMEWDLQYVRAGGGEYD